MTKKKNTPAKSRQKSAFSFLDALRHDPFLVKIYGITRRFPSAVYIVGGVLRNVFLKEDSGRDYDLSVDGDVRGVVERMRQELGWGFFLLDEDSSTYRVIAKELGSSMDISRLKGQDIESDLGERDFTLNAIALRLDAVFKTKDIMEGVIDPFGGLKDAGHKILRVLTPLAFDNDPLRILRGIRLAQRHGLRIDALTLGLIRLRSGLLKDTALERIRDELVLIFLEAGSSKTIKTLFELGVGKTILPELREWEDSSYDLLNHSLDTLKEAERVLKGELVSLYPKLKNHFDAEAGGIKRLAVFKLGAFFHDIGKPLTMKVEDGVLRFIGHEAAGEGVIKRVLRRLRFSRKAIKTISSLVRNHHRIFTLAKIPEPSIRTRFHFFNAVGGDAGLDLLCMGLADARATRGGEDPGLLKCVREMLDFYFNIYVKKKSKPLMTGEEIMKAFGIREGPIVGEIMRKISDGVESGEVRSKKSAISYVKKQLEKKD